MIGMTLAHYQITGHLGSGGMGDVYQATDSKLGRSVAIKLLPDAFAADTERASRFQREARMLASLNHPNVAAIHGLEESGERKFLVMELVDGETLAERIRRGPIPLAEALPIAKQIAEALEAAHEKGIVHRDLKPANIKITPDGTVKVLDFGLAKAYDTETPHHDVSNSPTMASMGATSAGIILGTAAYMSPEQAKGRAVDKRTDIFAFGCVLFEMLTGRRAFDGDDVTEILGAVVRLEPDWRLLPAHVTPRVRELLRLCLEKKLKNRRSDAADVRLDIESALREPAAEALPATASRHSRAPWLVASVALLVAAALAILAVRDMWAPAPGEMRVEITTPPTPLPFEFALSPDGGYICFVASGGGPVRLWLRALNKTEAQPLAGTEGASQPFWSPDSRSIAFFSSGRLRRIDIAGGPPQALATVGSARGGTWGADGSILFSPGTSNPLFRIAAAGGEPVPVTRLDPPRQASHRFPQFLPDGRSFLFYVTGTPETAGVYLASVDDGEATRLTAADTAAAYLHPGWVLFLRQTALLAQRLDIAQRALLGDPVVVADPVGSGNNYGGVSASSTGLLAYRSGSGGRTQLAWYDRTGKAIGVVGEPDSNSLVNPELSPDGTLVVVQRSVQSNNDLWVLDLARTGSMTRFTFDPLSDNFPVWSADGTRIVFVSNRNGQFDLFMKSASGAGVEEVFLQTSGPKVPLQWSKDERFFLYNEGDPKTGRDLWALPLAGNERKPIALAATPFEEDVAEISPDGHWLAYQTNESGRYEIMVQPFPQPTGKWQVSTNGGTQPRWRADGKELYFVAPDGKLMAVSISTAGSTVKAGTPTALFTAPLAPGLGAMRHQYTVSRDGRFLINQQTESSAAPITLVLNWMLQNSSR